MADGRTTLLPADPRRRRLVIALAGAAVLALVVVLQRRSAAAAPTSAAQDAVASDPAYTAAGGLPAGSTFADNGESMSGLSYALTTGLGNVGTSLDQLAASVQGMESLSQAQPGSTDATTNAGAAAAPAPITINLNTGASSPAKRTAAKAKAAPAKPKVDARGHTRTQRAAIRSKNAASQTAYQRRLAASKRKRR